MYKHAVTDINLTCYISESHNMINFVHGKYYFELLCVSMFANEGCYVHFVPYLPLQWTKWV